MASIESCKTPSWWLVIGTIVSFVCSFIISGHGGLPMGMLLVIGIVWGLQDQLYWLIPVVIWWFCLFLIAVGKLIEKRGILSQIGVVGLSISWVFLLWFGEAEIPETLFISTPFLVSIGFWIKFWLLKFSSININKGSTQNE